LKTDLDVYLEEDVFIFESENDDDSDANFDANFDALVWWKSNVLKYRILSKDGMGFIGCSNQYSCFRIIIQCWW
jgi:hypothetical protein